MFWSSNRDLKPYFPCFCCADGIISFCICMKSEFLYFRYNCFRDFIREITRISFSHTIQSIFFWTHSWWAKGKHRERGRGKKSRKYLNKGRRKTKGRKMKVRVSSHLWWYQLLDSSSSKREKERFPSDGPSCLYSNSLKYGFHNKSIRRSYWLLSV